MIYPANIVIDDTTNALDLKQQEDIERSFDTAIWKAGESRSWPAFVNLPRSGWTQENVSAVAKKYRDAKWIVTINPHRDAVASIMHPDVTFESRGRIDGNPHGNLR